MKNIVYICCCLIIVSCTKISDVPQIDNVFGEGAYLVNEGNFNSGNGSLSFYSYDSTKLYNDIFASINGRPLGDVPNSVVSYSSMAYIVVNNSGKIEVIDQGSFKSAGTINGLISPRNMAVINDGKAYVTSMYSDSLAIIDLIKLEVSGYINIHKSSEAITVIGNQAYVSSWIGGNKIMLINTLTDKVIDSIEVGQEPESMVVDRENRLWVLCTGGWQKQYAAELDLINTYNKKIEKKYVFPSVEASPSCLRIDWIGQNIYYLDNGVRKMDIYSPALPGSALIPGSFYKIGINPANSDILVSDAGDYVHNGFLQIYKNDGTFIQKYQAGIIPGTIIFKSIMNPHQNL